MTRGRPNAAYAGQVVAFPDPLRRAKYPDGVRVDEQGHPDFRPFARAAAEIKDPPPRHPVDEVRVTDIVSANAALRAEGHELWQDVGHPVATPEGWTWHHATTPASVPGWRRLELVPVEVKALLRHHGGFADVDADLQQRGTRPLQQRRPVHFTLAEDAGVDEAQLQTAEESLGYTLPGPYRAFLKAAGGRGVAGLGLLPELGVLLDQPFFTLRQQPELDDLVYVNKCLRDHVTKDYLGIAYAQGGLLTLKVKGERAGTVWFLPYDDARDDGDESLTPQARCERLLLHCADDFDDFLRKLAGSPTELQTVAQLMVGGFARAVPVEG
ncbi:SMI1/KNR4 family protein [Streptacidiphilus monticola]|uniref:SMI1/KNR4 family protein n=1 Tax=Streptacidiphilus monticola TaxID=2161674 RepID=A0ABW1FUS8_9ACTN